jgi:hypothetical protein
MLFSYESKCANIFQGNTNSGTSISPHSWTTIGDVDTMGWCCGLPLANGSCAQDFEIMVHAGTVLEDNTRTSGNSGCGQIRQTSHDIAIGLGVGIPTMIASISLLMLYLRERRARRWERQQRESLKGDTTPWFKSRPDGRSITTVTSDGPPWIKNGVEAHAEPRTPYVELEEMPWTKRAGELP